MGRGGGGGVVGGGWILTSNCFNTKKLHEDDRLCFSGRNICLNKRMKYYWTLYMWVGRRKMKTHLKSHRRSINAITLKIYTFIIFLCNKMRFVDFFLLLAKASSLKRRWETLAWNLKKRTDKSSLFLLCQQVKEPLFVCLVLISPW